jgi:hypothetical protein
VLSAGITGVCHISALMKIFIDIAIQRNPSPHQLSIFIEAGI